MSEYKKNSITLIGAVGLGTGVMISAGIFALLGQVAELSGKWFPLLFIIGSIVSGFSAYSYIKLSNEYPSAGGIGMYLIKEYGKSTLAVTAALLMAFSMVINQSLVARTFGTYLLQLFDYGALDYLVPFLGVGLIIFAFIVNILSNKFIQSFTLIISLIKILGLIFFALAALWVVDFSISPAVVEEVPQISIQSYIGATALTILAFKGFTTITNSGSEIKNPNKNVGRAIIISLIVSLLVYVILAWAVSSNLSLQNITEAKNYALAEAARPALGYKGVWFTVIIAIIATVSGIIASIFAVSRMLAMLTNMNLIFHRHFNMPGSIQKHTLVYTVVIAILLTLFFDLTRIASMGAILYLIMDMIIHWGLFRNLRGRVKANRFIVFTALILDIIVLFAFIWVKIYSDLLVVILSLIFVVIVYIGQKMFLSHQNLQNEQEQHKH